ncbi:DUF3887 domain-containing protein [Arabiibacter massiliensis]|uniref:DUF3887 domain-containing protein n=1 Tax=Arabiibacter massiliensis TaxID=1870985 RepID=UPI0009B9A1D6|nr:DUF3887 domain-containing protein [Arabiibacter massiliensis]
MNRESYVKAVAKRLSCSKARRDEFVRDLEADIAAALEAGEGWEQVERRLGDPRQVAAEFNEGLSEQELAAGRKRKRTKMIAIAAAVVIVLAAVIGGAAWWVAPKTAPVGTSSGASEQALVTKAQEAAEVIAANDYDAFLPMLDPSVAQALSEPVIADAHALFGDDWGPLKSYGNAYSTQIEQMGLVLDVVEFVANYENATVTFTMSFNKDMKIMGLNLR